MTAREELIEIVTRDPESSGGDEIWATDLVDAYRIEVLREAAEKVESLLVETPEYGTFVADFLRGMAGGAR